jgi:murein DD-endopeptidase MepM/ murein hydrolase activator NlpD
MVDFTSKKIIWFAVPAALTISMFMCATTVSLPAKASTMTAEQLRQAIDAKSRELENLNNQIKSTQAQLDTISTQKQTLKGDIAKLDYTIHQLELAISASKVSIQKMTLELAALNDQRIQTEQAISSNREAIGETLRELQSKDNEELLTILLKNQSLSDGVLELQSLQNFQDKLRSSIDAMTALSADLAQTIDKTSQKKAEIEIENRNARNRQLIVQDQKSQKSILLQETKDRENIYQSQLSALQKQRDSIGQEIADMEQQLRAKFDPSVLPLKRPGVLAYPVANPLVTQEYGATAFAQRAYGTKFHNGIDFAASIGTPIMAAEDGTVFAVGNNGRYQYGRYIVIKHENNLATIYAHMSRQIVSVNQTVVRGQIIGYSGDTGYATGPHLHFGVYWAPSVTLQNVPPAGLVPIGVAINPADYL